MRLQVQEVPVAPEEFLLEEVVEEEDVRREERSPRGEGDLAAVPVAAHQEPVEGDRIVIGDFNPEGHLQWHRNEHRQHFGRYSSSLLIPQYRKIRKQKEVLRENRCSLTESRVAGWKQLKEPNLSCIARLFQCLRLPQVPRCRKSID